MVYFRPLDKMFMKVLGFEPSSDFSSDVGPPYLIQYLSPSCPPQHVFINQITHQ